MISSLRTMWLLMALSSSLFVMVLSDGPAYLPPSNGYNYDRPSIPFDTNSNGNKIGHRTNLDNYESSSLMKLRSRFIPPTPGPARPPSQPRPTYIPPSPGPGPSPGPSPNPHDHSQDHDHGHDHGHDHHHEPGMPFDFAYQVTDDGNDYSHNAISDGDITRGEYRVALPDGRTQIVKYTADWKNGFNAEVTYEGEARYPDPPAGGYGPSNGGGQAYGPPSQGGGYKY